MFFLVNVKHEDPPVAFCLGAPVQKDSAWISEFSADLTFLLTLQSSFSRKVAMILKWFVSFFLLTVFYTQHNLTLKDDPWLFTFKIPQSRIEYI